MATAAKVASLHIADDIGRPCFGGGGQGDWLCNLTLEVS
jgi:hypothetical protein